LRHRKLSSKLGLKTSHRKSLLSNLAVSLIRHEMIKTTCPRAKELRRFVEKIITTARKGDLHSRRLVSRKIHDREAMKKLFGELSERFRDRPGGYTRIVRCGFRNGDNAPMCIIEFVDRRVE
jgi:large subunit ribosomal protein L17